MPQGFDIWQVVEIVVIVLAIAGAIWNNKHKSQENEKRHNELKTDVSGKIDKVSTDVRSDLGLHVGYIKEDIKRLELKQDKHNGLIERMVKVEQSTSSAHHRIDDLRKGD